LLLSRGRKRRKRRVGQWGEERKVWVAVFSECGWVVGRVLLSALN